MSLTMSQTFSQFLPCATPGYRMFDTGVETLIMQDFCSAPLIESLRVDDGLRAFARLPQREHQLLKQIAQRPNSMVALAYTRQGTIVGQVSLVPADSRWQGSANMYEVAFEVSSSWRRQGIAQHLLQLVFELDCLEDLIIIGLGLSWHWDIEGLGLTPFAYRAMIAQLFAQYRFAEYLTTEGNIRMDPANIFLARIGKRTSSTIQSEFYQRLLQSDTLPGM